MTYHFYPKNTFNSAKCNKTFEEVLALSEEDFKAWILDVRKTIVDLWDTQGIPPVNGYSEAEIKKQFTDLQNHNVAPMWIKDSEETLCIRNTHNKLGNACNSWFPTMMKTRIDYGTGTPKSIYDFMKEDSLIEKYMPYGRRHFKRDSFYAYSQCVDSEAHLPTATPPIKPKNSVEYIQLFEAHERKEKEVLFNLEGDPVPQKEESYDYWIAEKDEEAEYSGYNEAIKKQKFHSLTYDELQSLLPIIPKLCLTNIKEWNKDSVYMIRQYKKGQRIFPDGLKSFRISVCQYAVNYPPPMAKAVWEKYTEEFKTDEKVIVWDPSCGWGGRILGAMSVKDDRKILYLGTDPNPDHIIRNVIKNDDGEPMNELYTKYDDIANFVNNETARAGGRLDGKHTNEWKVWSLGSEVIQHNPEFQQYKGKVSVVFTSPPYFHREVYSEDANQSCNKFSAYQDWKDGFLYETLKTAYTWLRPGGYICWNIADIKEAGTYVSLEKDSADIMKSFGMEYVETLKMVMGQMPGAGRTKTDEEGNVTSTNKNSVKLKDGKFFRYEPIFVFKKPV